MSKKPHQPGGLKGAQERAGVARCANIVHLASYRAAQEAPASAMDGGLSDEEAMRMLNDVAENMNRLETLLAQAFDYAASDSGDRTDGVSAGARAAAKLLLKRAGRRNML